ncbi:hypothetical protein KJ596_01745 [Patescibacteria group bacterium]|nr:hypothetical protein [Patescibacteria group bacterium]MBU1868375.1 hypothetical protein [Patescibacteria group bacterium]
MIDYGMSLLLNSILVVLAGVEDDVIRDKATDLGRVAETDREKEHYVSVIRKLRFVDYCRTRLIELNRVCNDDNAWLMEFYFTSGIYLCVALLDSLACLIGDLFLGRIDERDCAFNKSRFFDHDSLPDGIKLILSDEKKGLNDLYELRRELIHRSARAVIPAGQEPGGEVESFVVFEERFTDAIGKKPTEIIEFFDIRFELCRRMFVNIATIILDKR